MSKYSKGPWSVVVNDHGSPIKEVVGSDGRGICEIYEGDKPEAVWATANLIAAAPDILIELRQAVIQMEMAAECIQNGRYDEALLHASSLMHSKRAAIAKATGE